MTVSDLLALCLKDIGVTGEGQTASAEAINDSFTTLQQMIAMWQADSAYVYALQDNLVAANGTTKYTIGPGGDFSITRPAVVQQCYWRSGTADFTVQMLTSFDDYERICVKAVNSVPSVAYYMPTMPLGTLYVYPYPTTGELHIVTPVDLPSLATIGDTISIPPEYQMAIRYSLLEHLALVFSVPLRSDIPALAANARRIMKRNNVRVPILSIPYGIADSGVANKYIF